MTAAASPYTRAEVLKLARLLRVHPDSLGVLDSVSDADLALFREQVTDVLFGADSGTLKRLGAAAKLLPGPILARIAEKVFGPLLCARVAGLIDPDKAADTAKRLSPAFLADVAVELDPRRAHAVISALPPKLIAPVAVELAARQDWITLGRFVGYLSEEPLAACITELDEAALLRIALVVEDSSAIPLVIDLLPRSRQVRLLMAASEQNLWPVLLGRAGSLPDHLVGELAELLAEQDRALIDTLATVVVDHNLWTELLPFARVLPADAQSVLADVARTLPPAVRADIISEAKRLGVLTDLGPIADALTASAA
ncbi:MAG: hypothetical protein ACRDQ7_02645 [Haloechinothrix sp.]